MFRRVGLFRVEGRPTRRFFGSILRPRIAGSHATAHRFECRCGPGTLLLPSGAQSLAGHAPPSGFGFAFSDFLEHIRHRYLSCWIFLRQNPGTGPQGRTGGGWMGPLLAIVAQQIATIGHEYHIGSELHHPAAEG